MSVPRQVPRDVTPAEAARIVGCTTRWLRILASDGRLRIARDHPRRYERRDVHALAREYRARRQRLDRRAG